MNFWQWLDRSDIVAFLFLFLFALLVVFGVPIMVVYVHNNDKTMVNVTPDAGAPDASSGF